MKQLTLKTMVVIALLSQTSIAMAQQKPDATFDNKQIVREQFDRWVNGSGNFFDLLADNVEWTVAGKISSSGVYKSKKSFLEEAVNPITEKLSTRITPKLLGIYQDNETVTLLWEGTATAKDNKPYKNTYCWILTMKDGKISKGIAFLDTHVLHELMTRVR
ncbi:MAG: nuclear transport factor 2 family protein [Segetibacter sp.]